MTALIAHDWWRARTLGRPRWELVLLAAILAIAAAARIVWIIYVTRRPQELNDPLFYIFFGEQISLGNGYRLLDGSPTAYYPVGYPAALGAIFALVRHTPIPDNFTFAATSFQAFLGVATVLFAYEVGRRLFSPAVGLVSGLWIAVFPNLVFHTGAFLSETLFNFLIMASLLVLFAGPWRERRLTPLTLVAFGLVLGVSALVRPISLLFLPLLAIVWLLAGFGWRRAFGYTGAIALTAVAVIAPWSIRNFAVMDAPVIISTNLGDDLCMGHHPGAPGRFVLPDFCFGGYEQYARPEYEVRRHDENIEKAVRYAVRHPLREIELIYLKARWTYNHDHDAVWAAESYSNDPFIGHVLRSRLNRLADGFFFLTLIVGAPGVAALALSNEPRRRFLLLAMLALGLVPLAFFGDPRFHVPAMPLLSIAAAWATVAAGRVAWSRVERLRAANAGGRASGAVEVAEGEGAVSE